MVQTNNEEIDRLKCLENYRREFVGNVSHELKTPLSVLKGEIELALRKERSVDYYKETLNISL